ncbi:hypothetical protein [Corynebacterium durum]|uniref:hypothetical protein n=1 Tax=Corynebacterium durum TaxID=61592 RepID=UPI002889A5FE|nr:hypothetical protein [Corynebacterium durum]
MRTLPRRMITTLTAGMLATAVFAGAVTTAPEANAQRRATSSTDNTLSSDVGSSELQSFYNKSPDWGQFLLMLITGGMLLEGVGYLIGPARLQIQHLIPNVHI